MGGAGSILGMGAQLAGGIMGANAQEEANAENRQRDAENFFLANQERNDRIQAAYDGKRDKEVEQTKNYMGASDAQGNRVSFDPATGWHTDLSYMGQHQQQLADTLNTAQNQEKMTELSHDVPMERAQMDRAFGQNAQAGTQADSFARMLHDAILQGPDQSQGSQLYTAQAKGINDAFNATQSDAARTAIRSGASNAGTILAQLAKERSNQLAQASVQDMYQGRQDALNNYNSKIGGLAQLAQMFSQASRSPLAPTQYSPSGATSYSPASGLASGQESAAAALGLNNGDDAIINAQGQKGGRLDYVQPQYGMANTLTQLGGSLGNIGRSGGSSGGGLSSLSNAFMTNSGVF